MMTHPDGLLTRERLLDSIWGVDASPPRAGRD